MTNGVSAFARDITKKPERQLAYYVSGCILGVIKFSTERPDVQLRQIERMAAEWQRELDRRSREQRDSNVRLSLEQQLQLSIEAKRAKRGALTD